MKKQLSILSIIILSLNCYPQISFDKGYYIDNSGQKIECLIKNRDWDNNPNKFVCKLTEYGEEKTLTIESAQEFGINNASKYIRKNVEIDRTGNKISELNSISDPVFIEEKLFLEVLVEGKANLYSYVDGELVRYFFNKDSFAIEQLIYKEYITAENKVAANKKFKQQLWSHLKCPCISLKEITQTDYRKNELVSLFKTYHVCSNFEFVSFEANQRKKSYNISIRPGVNRSSLSMAQESGYRVDFLTELSFRAGIEAEFILPVNKNKWTVIMEPTYQYFKSEKTGLNRVTATANYKSIELPIGLRHYIFFNRNSKFFINSSFVLDFDNNSEIKFTNNSRNLGVRTGVNFAFGFGYKYNNRYSIEFRHLTRRNIFYSYYNYTSDYNTSSLIFGYTVFKNTP